MCLCVWSRLFTATHAALRCWLLPRHLVGLPISIILLQVDLHTCYVMMMPSHHVSDLLHQENSQPYSTSTAVLTLLLHGQSSLIVAQWVVLCHLRWPQLWRATWQRAAANRTSCSVPWQSMHVRLVGCRVLSTKISLGVSRLRSQSCA